MFGTGLYAFKFGLIKKTKKKEKHSNWHDSLATKSTGFICHSSSLGYFWKKGIIAYERTFYSSNIKVVCSLNVSVFLLPGISLNVVILVQFTLESV